MGLVSPRYVCVRGMWKDGGVSGQMNKNRLWVVLMFCVLVRPMYERWLTATLGSRASRGTTTSESGSAVRHSVGQGE